MNLRVVPPSRLWLLALGYGIWCSALVMLYAVHALGCAFAWPAGSLRVALVAILLVHLAALAWFWRAFSASSPDPALGATGNFFHEIARWTLLAALLDTLLTFGPPLLLSTCV